jgi:hypothetical protein
MLVKTGRDCFLELLAGDTFIAITATLPCEMLISLKAQLMLSLGGTACQIKISSVRILFHPDRFRKSI